MDPKIKQNIHGKNGQWKKYHFEKLELKNWVENEMETNTGVTENALVNHNLIWNPEC